MHTNARDMYISVLEKRAAEAVAPDYGVDSQAVANKEVASNSGDQRAQLGGLLNAAKATEAATTKQVGQLLPIAKKTTGTTSSNPLLKVAMHEAFFTGVRQTDLLKTAELEYLRTAYRGFEDEMSKLAGQVGVQPTETPCRGAGISELVDNAADPRYENAVAKFAASFTSEQAVRARQAQENLPENSDPAQTAHRSTAR